MLIDTHCHLTHAKLAPEIDAVIERARQAGLVGCITIGTGVEDARAGLVLARRAKGFISCAAGIDPHTAHRLGDEFGAELGALRALLTGGGFVALGEVGLDYHYDYDPAPVQIERLEHQLELARELGLPVVIHVREAHEDMLAVLREHPPANGVIHSFTAGPREAEGYLDLGWHLGFNGVLTFKNAEELRAAASITPDERLLVETDSPYLAPVPLRGRRCEPAFVRHTAEALAVLRGTSPDELAGRTTANAIRLFGVDPGRDRSSSLLAEGPGGVEPRQA